MIRVVIVEDEKWASKELERNLKILRPAGIEILAILETVAETIDWFTKNDADLLFLDINLGDGNSFSIFDKIDLNCPIIFATAYDQYALQAFKYYSIDYLLKPIDIETLENAIIKYEDKYNKEKNDFDYSKLQDFLITKKESNYKERFVVSIGDQIHSIGIEKVSYFMAEGKALYLVDTDSKRYLIDGTLTALEKRLNPSMFFRINRQFCLSFNAIDSMIYYSKSRIKVNLKPVVFDIMDAIVSQERSTDFKNWLDR